jgi:hypothetical protein
MVEIGAICGSYGRSVENGGAVMTIGLAGCFGLFLGAIAGGVIGIGLGFAWTAIFHTTSFEGYSGMLIFFTFMPIGIIVGALIGAVGMGVVAARDSAKTPPAGTS